MSATKVIQVEGCPICGQVYENSFKERFDIAADEDRCRDLLLDLKEELRAVETKLEERQRKVSELSSELSEIAATLNQKQGEVQLYDIVKSEGRKEMRRVLDKDVAERNSIIGDIDRRIVRATQDLKDIEDKERSKQINAEFRAFMRTSLSKLALLNVSESSYKTVYFSIKESGSKLPRALLAYYYAILNTIAKRSTSCFCPIVIDSPKQQDQDDANWEKIIEFTRDFLPTDSQLVLGLVDDMGINFGGNVIELKEKFSVMNKESYEEVASIVRPLIDASLVD
ncbi:hypothetical protein [Anatilimnocola floriformis]|uniref:hypothetical protein n=1 Tax=Anatilimnocola floriformis TaxID=2948575 RepID=UPI0020C45901|nr:hypothetical protein [Anatilimnocola floriformis]